MPRLPAALVVGLLAACAGGDGGGDDAASVSGGWTVTVYYTAVEEHHDGPPVTVTGCPELDCVDGDDALGSYPSDFVEAVEAEGTGRITRGPHAGEYLNWSYDVGFWLDSAPRASDGDLLEPWRTAAADPDVLAEDTRFTLMDCGRLEEGGPPPAGVCDRLREADWVIADEFTPGLGGDHHVDVYVGEETGPGFTDSDLFTTLVDVQIDTTTPD